MVEDFNCDSMDLRLDDSGIVVFISVGVFVFYCFMYDDGYWYDIFIGKFLSFNFKFWKDYYLVSFFKEFY